MIRASRASANDAADLLFYTQAAGGSNSEKMRIDSTGRVGINRVPAITNAKLEVGGADNVPLINVEASGVTGGMGIGSTGLQFYHGTSAMMRINSSGNVLIDSTSAITDARVTVHGGDLMVKGDNNSAGISDLLPGYTRGDYGTFRSSANTIYFVIGSSYVSYIASNGTYNVSDVSLKKDITDLSGSLAKVLQLKGRSFKWKDSERGTDTNIGFIAQEVETVVPELVSDGGLGKDNAGNDAPKNVNYANMSVLLVEAIKELEARVKTLEG